MARKLRLAGDKGGAIVPYIPPTATAQSADEVAGLLDRIRGMVPKSGPGAARLVGMGTLAAGLPALLEFTDTEDPLARNALQAGTRFAGGLGMGAAGAALGQLLIPIPGVGAVVGGTLGGILGDQVGQGVGGGIYDMFKGSPQDRAREENAKNVRLQTQLALERLTEMAPLQEKLAQMADARAVNMARRNMEIQRDYNFGNTLDASTLMGQQNFANQILAAQQNTYSL